MEPLAEPETEPLAEPEAPAVEVSVEPLVLEALDDGLVVVADGVVVAVEPEDGVVAVEDAPVPDVDVLLAGRSQPVANAAASARAAVSEISFIEFSMVR